MHNVLKLMMIIEKNNNNECDSTRKLACAFAVIEGQVNEHSFSWFDCSSTRQKFGSVLLLLLFSLSAYYMLACTNH